jgi:glutathione S-transferase
MAAMSVDGRGQQRPVLYSFRRCPYAIRARLALAAAGWEPGRDLELREVNLAAKPPELLAASAKATVPVLVSADGVLDESLVIMDWTLQQHDPGGWLRGWGTGELEEMETLIAENDGPFKHHLDRFRYPDRYGPDGQAQVTQHRSEAVSLLRGWSSRLAPAGWLLGARPSLADLALLPFVRQFRLTDPEGFDREPELGPLQGWLARFLEGPELAAVLEPPWAQRSPWHSPGWIYHLALRDEWQEARVAGEYRRSTRGLSLEQVGFIHASYAHQVPSSFERFYREAGAVVLLAIDPNRLEKNGVAVRPEPAPESGELFPHLYGALPLEAVVLVERYGV